ncbi:hypothetical protein FSP39_023707 [Pinctada imbricata]|uniref:Paraneoplastic antigen Ma-like C-terminal domain-containing protein n=1 Tax=Pinctada imbricata TaxID=66713 RepID=A0AA88YH21_PINIB|nr:hypothetical protein FSP39_023707 [Pinctada imbricata]
MSTTPPNQNVSRKDEQIERMITYLNEHTPYKVVTETEFQRIDRKGGIPQVQEDAQNAFKLNDKSDQPITMKHSTPRDKGAISKIRTEPKSRSAPNANMHHALSNASNVVMLDPPTANSIRPRFPVFSGEEKSDCTFEVWKFEVKCALREGTCSDTLILQSIRSSLKGKARNLLLTLPEDANPNQILDKLEGVFGNIYPSEQLIQQFYGAKQRTDESVADYGMRLESLLQTCIDRGDISHNARNDMLRTKLWSGLCNAELKNASRYKYDTITDFDSLRIELRSIELDMSSASVSKDTKRSTVSQINDTRSEASMDAILSKLEMLNKRMDSMEREMKSVRAPYNQEQRSYGSNANRGYPRGGYRGGTFRGGSQGGSFRGGSQGGTFRGGSQGGSFRGGYQDGTFRGGSRGGSFRGGSHGEFRGGYRERRSFQFGNESDSNGQSN